MGWAAHIFDNGPDAILFLKSTDVSIDCVFVDVRMPVMNGRQVVERILLRFPDLPVVVMSGYSRENLHGFLRYNNVLSLLEKPFSTSAFVDAIGRVVSETA